MDDESYSETDSFWWQDASSAMLSFLANEQMCSMMLDNEEPPSAFAVDVLEQSMEWAKDVGEENHDDEGSSFGPMDDCSINELMASASQAQLNDTIEAMDFYIKNGKRYRAGKKRNRQF